MKQKHISIDTFVRRLRKLKGQFILKNDGQIRCRKGRCPIEVVSGDPKAQAPGDAVRLVGLSVKDADNIMSAADFKAIDLEYMSGWSTAKKKSIAALRARLLRALGLTEKTEKVA